MPPLERLNYYPGQRLDAVDLNLEADYEIKVRRLLNQGLFTPGVVSGLEVGRPKLANPPNPRQIEVLAGLALDGEGREIYLADDTVLQVPNQLPPAGGHTYYLLITYDEQKVPASDRGCASTNGPNTFSRVRQTPFFMFTTEWPNPAQCKGTLRNLDCGIFLASVTLDDSCQVASIDTGLRQYSFPAHSSQVHEASYEGEKDIAPGEPKRLFFHIRGGAPHGVILYLRGAQFSRLWYTELGHHSHSFTAKANTSTGPSSRATVDLTHTHTTPDSGSDMTDSAGTHNHGIWSMTPTRLSPTFETIATVPGGIAGTGWWDHNVRASDGSAEPSWIGTPTVPDNTGTPAANHQHQINLPSLTTNSQNTTSSPMDHTHSFDASGATIGDSGVTDVSARTGLANSFITDLQVKLDNVDITANILKQLGLAAPLGGTAFNSDAGTGGIDLLRLPLIAGQPPLPDLGLRQHVLEFSIQSGTGGKVLYNLYVE